MNNLIFIHGGDSFLDDSSYVDFLQKSYVPSYSKPWEDVSKKDYRVPMARKWVQEGWKVYYPTMPNKQNARYRDWKIIFDGIIEKLSTGDRLTLVWWSLGGCFLLKYFGEIEKYDGTPQTETQEKINLLFIENIHLVAACISEWDFTATENYDTLRSLGSKVHIWHSQDDLIVPFSTAESLQKQLPAAQTHFFWSEKWYGHFHGIERLPELEAVLLQK